MTKMKRTSYSSNSNYSSSSDSDQSCESSNGPINKLCQYPISKESWLNALKYLKECLVHIKSCDLSCECQYGYIHNHESDSENKCEISDSDYESDNSESINSFNPFMEMLGVTKNFIIMNKIDIAKITNFEALHESAKWFYQNVLSNDIFTHFNASVKDMLRKLQINLMICLLKFNHECQFKNKPDPIFELFCNLIEWYKHVAVTTKFYRTLIHLDVSMYEYLSSVTTTLIKSNHNRPSLSKFILFYEASVKMYNKIHNFDSDDSDTDTNSDNDNMSDSDNTSDNISDYMSDYSDSDSNNESECDVEGSHIIRTAGLIVHVMTASKHLENEIPDEEYFMLMNIGSKYISKLEDDEINELMESKMGSYIKDIDDNLPECAYNFEIKHQRLHCIQDNCSDALYMLDRCTNFTKYEACLTHIRETIEAKLVKINEKLQEICEMHNRIFRTQESIHRYRSKKFTSHKRRLLITPEQIKLRIKEAASKKQKEIEEFQNKQLKLYIDKKFKLKSNADKITSINNNIHDNHIFSDSHASSKIISKKHKRKKKNKNIIDTSSVPEKVIIEQPTDTDNIKNNNTKPYFLKKNDYKTYEYIFNMNKTSHLEKTNYKFTDVLNLLYAFGGDMKIQCDQDKKQNNVISYRNNKKGSHIVIKVTNGNLSQTFLYVEHHEFLYTFEIDKTMKKLTTLGFTPDRITLAE